MPRGIKKVVEPIAPVEIPVEDQLKIALAKVDELEGVLERTFEKCRTYEKQLDEMQAFYQKRMKFVLDNMELSLKNVALALKGDL